ncbi:YceD family protein [Acuticoccus mangrovi]|uniref:DUF177 domain-containing protein n=1 Tax=Acuticoccus mangrovi TaxID=2796142 RepID=A0A934IMD4_9HYPH|nr:YceD family protein [Acuticoccus mangrovi]MBJ3776492.1 DUF177 domain-containing protein [Acuticoccus mangrovi]
MIARLARPISIRRLTKEEHVAIEASEAERAALAEALDLLSLTSLTADLSVSPWRSEGVRVRGTVRGTVSQACVVTLEPVEGVVEEEIDVRLHPDAGEATQVEVDPEAADPPEALESDVVDVGAIALEHFVLGLDPYPRVPGAAFEEEAEAEEEEPSPFAALAALKKGAS